MSVPLDRLYNFLFDIVNLDDLIIYQFLPHGSRKLDDLVVALYPSKIKPSWVNTMTTPCMIFHDQEPLMYDFYTDKDFDQYLNRTKGKTFHPNVIPRSLMNLMISMHLRCCVAATTNIYDQTLLCHSEKNSRDLELYTNKNFIGVYYWSHALIARDWYRYARLDPQLAVDFDKIRYDFLIYNRAWSGTREYRLALAEMLANHDLIANCNTKFSATDNEIYYSQHQFVNPNFKILRHDLHELYLPNLHDSSASGDYDNQDYATSAVEVVLETLFDDTRWHLTEKTLRPIACGRPFLLAATPGSLEYLREYGFKTFDGLIDETYDTIQDPRARLQALVTELKRISGLEADRKRSLWIELYKIAKHNQTLFFSDQWHQQIVDEFKTNYQKARCQLTATAKYHRALDDISQHDPEMIAWRATSKSDWGGPTQQERQQLADLIQQLAHNQ